MEGSVSRSSYVAARPIPVERNTLRDRMLAWRDRIYSSPSFHAFVARVPLLRSVARARSQAVFDLVAGFTYTKTLAACLDLRLLELLQDSPKSITEIAKETGLTIDSLDRLLEAAIALRLLSRRSGDRYGLGALGSPILAQPGVGLMVAHNALLYEDLSNPVALLKRPPGSSTAVGHFFPYAETASPELLNAERVANYSRLMAETVEPIAQDVLGTGLVPDEGVLLDVGGGEGRFLETVAHAKPSLRLRLFDLPAVADRAEQRARSAGFDGRLETFRGDFHSQPLPGGNDAISLIRILLDHEDARVVRLLDRARQALAPGGMLVIGEPMKEVWGAHRVGEVYFSLYLHAMGRGRCRSFSELRAMLRRAGFRRVDRLQSRYPVFASILVARP